MIGSANRLRVKTFADYTDGDVEFKLNKFFEENPNIEVIDIKYFNGYGTIENIEIDTYGRETAMIVYREPKKDLPPEFRKFRQ